MSRRLTLADERRMLAEARRLVRHVPREEWERELRDRLGVARLDQFNAAGAEARRLLFEQRPPGLPHHSESRSEDLGTLLYAGMLRCFAASSCEHAALGDRPLSAFLAARVVACDRCLLRYRGALAASDRRASAGFDRICDLCLEEADTFVPFGVHFGPARIFGDACDRCARRCGIGEEAAA